MVEHLVVDKEKTSPMQDMIKDLKRERIEVNAMKAGEPVPEDKDRKMTKAEILQELKDLKNKPKEDTGQEIPKDISEFKSLETDEPEYDLDPKKFITPENLDTIDLTDDDLQKFFSGQTIVKDVPINKYLTVRYSQIGKKDIDALEKKATEGDDLKMMDVQKEIERLLLAASILEVNGQSIGENEEEVYNWIVDKPNDYFRLLWNWYLVFEKSVQLSITADNLKKI